MNIFQQKSSKNVSKHNCYVKRQFDIRVSCSNRCIESLRAKESIGLFNSEKNIYIREYKYGLLDLFILCTYQAHLDNVGKYIS